MEVTPASSRPASARRSGSHRSGTIGLELQSAYKFGLALGLGVAVIWSPMPVAAAGLVLGLAVALAARSLAVLTTDPSSARALRPRDHAIWDSAIAAILAATAVVFVLSGDDAAAGILGFTAVALAALRLRTRYVAP